MADHPRMTKRELGQANQVIEEAIQAWRRGGQPAVDEVLSKLADKECGLEKQSFFGSNTWPTLFHCKLKWGHKGPCEYREI